MKNKIFPILTVFVIALLIFKFFPLSEEKKVLRDLGKIIVLGKIPKPLLPIPAVFKIKKSTDFFTEDFTLEFIEGEHEFHLENRKALLGKIGVAFIKLKDFSIEIFDTSVKIQGDTATVITQARARGKIINIQDFFSEVRKFQLTLKKIDGTWRLKRVENINSEGL